MLKKIKLPYLIITVVFVGLGIFAYMHSYLGGTKTLFLDLMELRTVDIRFQTRAKIAPGPEVVLAVIDEKSLAQEGKWVWPRSIIAELITKLSDAGTRVIGFDVGFLEPDDPRLIPTIEGIQGQLTNLNIANDTIQNYLEMIKHEADNDRLLAEAIQQSKAKVVLGYFFQLDEESLELVDEDEYYQHQENIRGSRHKFVRFTSEEAQQVPFIEATVPQSNIQLISEAAEYAGCFNFFPDWDGTVRRMPSVMRFDEDLYAPLSLMAVSAYLDSPPSVLVSDYGVMELQIGDLTIPTDELGFVLINYRGEEKTFPHISVTDILRDEVPPEMLKDKIVLVGATATGIYDMRVTPFGSVYPGLEIHANVVDSILSQDFLFQPEWSATFDLAAIIVSGIFLGLVLPMVGAIPGAVSAAVVFFGYMFLCQYLFSTQGWILNLVYPLSVMLLLYLSITMYRYLVENKQKRFIKDAFSTYLAPSVVKQLVDSGQNLVLGGEEREITAFFSDVQGFTSISEKLTPHELVELLNEYLTEMTDIILKHEGTVDKFEGDAIIAFFGAPNILPDHADRASLTTIEMQNRLAQLREKWEVENKPMLYMRIGLCTGPAVVGNMGSKSRMDYTMMGDTVNTAARLEG
ncbi:MAG: adenylate/guanylate cyclase domain-containing protein, partial [Desulfobacterales bacterium]